MAAVIVSRGKIAILESWLVEHHDDQGRIALEDAKVLLAELDDAVKDLIVAQSGNMKAGWADRRRQETWQNHKLP